MSDNKIISLLFVLLVIVAGSVETQERRSDALNLEADSVEYDYGKGSSVYRGNVSVKQGTMRLTGETVEIFTEDGDPVRILVESELSTFSDILSGKPFYVEAGRIDYDRHKRTIRLEGSVKMDYDGKTLHSERAMYDLNKHVIIAPKSDKRIRLTIDPEHQ